MTHGRPRQASITVTSTGLYKLYVNECNVGTALYYPQREAADSSAIEMSFDITPYLRSDTNVVALIYSPTAIHEGEVTHRQVSATIYGTAHDGKPFSFDTDGSWLCLRANSCMTSDGGEMIDGRLHDPSWKAATIYNLAMWTHAKADSQRLRLKPIQHADWSQIVSNISSYTTDDIASSADTGTLLELPTAVHGFLRTTIREAKKGENITIGNVHYICNGEIDEQAYPQFAVGTWRNILISGDKRFKLSQIMSLETLSVTNEITPFF